MKRCPQCNRTYSEDSFSFCLADGSLLSASFDPRETKVLRPQQDLRPQPTGNLQSSEALLALRKIEAAIEVGVNYQQYAQLVIDAKVKVKEGSQKLPDGELRKELNEAMDIYTDAVHVWRLKEEGLSLVAYSEVGKTIIPKYSLKDEPMYEGSRTTVYDSEAALKTIWGTAHQHIDRASKLLGE